VLLDAYKVKTPFCPRLPRSWILSQLRWSTLGYQYDWTKRCYYENDYAAFPNSLSSTVQELAAICGYEIIPEAAIVNFYPSSAVMGGHKDDAEYTLSVPIVSISIGAPAVFLIGGVDKNEPHPPMPLLLRSGDVVVMGGESRKCVHGVPRVFHGPEEGHGPPSYLYPDTVVFNNDDESREVRSQSEYPSPTEEWRLLRYLQTTRININVRQVYPS